jgi:hypothetical protein
MHRIYPPFVITNLPARTTFASNLVISPKINIEVVGARK